MTRWRVSEVNIGPAKLSRHDQDKIESTGIDVGEDVKLTESTLEDIVGGNRIGGKDKKPPGLKRTGGIRIGKNVTIKNSKIKKLTGGDEYKDGQL